MNLLCKMIGHKFVKRVGDLLVLEAGSCWRCGEPRLSR